MELVEFIDDLFLEFMERLKSRNTIYSIETQDLVVICYFLNEFWLYAMSFKKFLHLHLQIYWYEDSFIFIIPSFFVLRFIFVCVCMYVMLYRYEDVQFTVTRIASGRECLSVGVGTKSQFSLRVASALNG